ncbi:aldo/keto reductase [Saccharopolyspora erythraea]|nr:aldo/keto reductase [Saccharopolyspora erythraea]
MRACDSFGCPVAATCRFWAKAPRGMGERRSDRTTEIEALRRGLDLGVGLIDTAEMYGNGGAEEVVGEAIAGRRDEVFLVSKVFPHNASRRGAVEACERSLRRLNTDHIDLYLLHWRGGTPLAETLEAFEQLRADGRIGRFGVSNFDPDDMRELWEHELGRESVTDQVLYNLTRRGVEYDLLPWCGEHGLAVMAYSPIEQGRLLGDSVLKQVAQRHSATPAQVAIAWVLATEGVCAIPKAATAEHVEQNHAALEIRLSDEDLADLDARFPAPGRAVPLEIL